MLGLALLKVTAAIFSKPGISGQLPPNMNPDAAIMGILIIKCPNTGHDFSTGIQIEEESLERLPETMAKSRCPHCGGEHVWWTRESYLVADFGANHVAQD